MVEWFREEGLVSHDPPNVSAQENAGNPHYHPTRGAQPRDRPNELVLLDLWGKLAEPGAVFADITWVGFTGRDRPGEYRDGLCRCQDGRDAAVELVRDRHPGRPGAARVRSRPRVP